MIRNTKKRNEIINIIQGSSTPISAQEIYNKMSKNTTINLSTIYRTLELLTKENVLLQEIRNDKISYYQINNNVHKHRIICTKCNSNTIIDECPLKELEEHIKKDTGYKLTNHTFEVMGICPKCQSKIK